MIDDRHVDWLESLSNFSTAQSLRLHAPPEPDSMSEFESEAITGPLVNVLETNSKLKTLGLDPKLLPKAGPFCQQLKRCKHLTELYMVKLASSKEEYLYYFEHLASALSSSDVVTEDLGYWNDTSSGIPRSLSPCGPSNVDCFVALNKSGRLRKLVD
ncbi:unknown protein [Seminavis robusta]|uniref:Uncharacterized protein n=1 Tax=Seminavis robusta TaxID=568900 RepID=A0A9N8HAP5_9STRA|nr:unknown protein [Seminavis robusta]|eukprot:Sro232_g093980.1 n/a (157) ;mRNA; r:63891-64361